VNIIGFIISFVLFVGGIYIMGEAFYVEGLESLVFIGGILVSTIGAAIPIHIMKRIDA
jgi:cytochrome c biogenesis protein CcdA